MINWGGNRFIHNYTPSAALAAELASNGQANAYNTFVGVNAGNFGILGVGGQAAGGRHVGIGYLALSKVGTVSYGGVPGDQNTAVGFISAKETTTGYYNTSVGAYTLAENTTGANNTTVGADGLWKNTTGDNNTAVGAYVLQQNTIATDNTGVGKDVLRQTTTGGGNTAVGVSALVANVR